MWGIVAVVAAGGCQPDLQPVDMRDAIFFHYSVEQCNDNYKWCDEHVRHLRAVRCFVDAPPWLEHAENRAVQLRTAWCKLGDAKKYGSSYGEQCLHSLRQIIGPEAYYTGRMPNPVPVEFFPWD